MKDPVLDRAIEAAGGVHALAKALKIRGQAVSQWRRVPIGRVREVAEITGIPAHELRPDVATVFAPPARRSRRVNSTQGKAKSMSDLPEPAVLGSDPDASAPQEAGPWSIDDVALRDSCLHLVIGPDGLGHADILDRIDAAEAAFRYVREGREAVRSLHAPASGPGAGTPNRSEGSTPDRPDGRTIPAECG